jgi:hypothetical protein
VLSLGNQKILFLQAADDLRSGRRRANAFGLLAWARSDPNRLNLLTKEIWPLKFGHAFVEGGDLSRYLLGELSYSDANSKLQFYITDPVTVYEIWFEQYGRADPIADRRDKIVSKFVVMLDELKSKLDEVADIDGRVKELLTAAGSDALNTAERERLLKLKADVRSFREEITSPRALYDQVPIWKEYFGDEAAFVAAQILFAFHREKRALKRSDGIDFVHAMYLPYTDLWRGDKAFSDLLIKHGVNFSERVVPTLTELPVRVEAEIAKLQMADRSRPERGCS